MLTFTKRMHDNQKLNLIRCYKCLVFVFALNFHFWFHVILFLPACPYLYLYLYRWWQASIAVKQSRITVPQGPGDYTRHPASNILMIILILFFDRGNFFWSSSAVFLMGLIFLQICFVFTKHADPNVLLITDDSPDQDKGSTRKRNTRYLKIIPK